MEFHSRISLLRDYFCINILVFSKITGLFRKYWRQGGGVSLISSYLKRDGLFNLQNNLYTEPEFLHALQIDLRIGDYSVLTQLNFEKIELKKVKILNGFLSISLVLFNLGETKFRTSLKLTILYAMLTIQYLHEKKSQNYF